MAEQLRHGDPEEVGMSGERVRSAARLAERWVGEGHTSALVVLVARRGRIVVHEAFGRLTPDPDAPALPLDAIFGLASISKPITATAVMCLVEDGRVGLNRPVQEYLPEFVGAGKDAVMVHHLLTHTSGVRGQDVDAHAARIKDTVDVPAPAEGQHPTVARRLFFAYDAPLGTPPGTEFSYSNEGYMLLGEIVRRVSGQSLADFASARIFQPLGMRDTSFGLPAARRDRLARRFSAASPVPPTAYCAAIEKGEDYGVYSTALDLAVFGQMYLQRGSYGQARVLSPATVAAMTRNQIPGIGISFEGEAFPEAFWGLGWEIQANKRWRRGSSLVSPQTFRHGGSGGVNLWIDPLAETVGVYFSVLQRGAPGQNPPWRSDLFTDAVTAAIDA